MLDRGIGLRARGARPAKGRFSRLLALAAAGLILAGCSSSATPAPTTQPATPSQLASQAPSLVAPSAVPSTTAAPTSYPSGQVVKYDVLKSKAKQVAADSDNGASAGARVDGFAFDLFAHLDSNGNLCYSPTSIILTLGMVRAGAKGTTASQMDTVLHQFGAPGQEGQIVALLKQLSGQTYYADRNGDPIEPGHTPDPKAPDPVLLMTVADQLFSQKGMTVEPAYLDSLASAYGAGIGQLDFQSDPESARLTINKWASDNTKGRIKDVLQPGDVKPATRIALGNAIYLKANWFLKFDPADTKPGQFTTASGAKVTVPTMSLEQEMRYNAGTGYKAVEVPLDAMSTLTMDFIVPDDMKSFQSSLTTAKFNSILSSLTTYDVSYWLPKYSVESRVDVAKILGSMGMPDLFNADAADLSGITTEQKLYIDAVIHQANLDVDEQGVTAAAVTIALGLGGAGEPPPHVDFKIDHPFLYVIRDRQSGAILFMGRIDDPTTKS